MILKAAGILVVVTSLLLGCVKENVPTDSEIKAAVKRLEQKLKTEGDRISILESDIKRLEEQAAKAAATSESFEAFSRDAAWERLMANSEKIAYFTPGSTGYSNIKIDVGVLALTLANLESYANGTRASFNVGNLSSAGITGLKMKFDYGTVNEKGAAQAEGMKMKEVEFGETFIAGAWTSVSVVLDSLPPDKLGFIRVHDVTQSGITLNTLPKKY